jgi:hypothetical protein
MLTIGRVNDTSYHLVKKYFNFFHLFKKDGVKKIKNKKKVGEPRWPGSFDPGSFDPGSFDPGSFCKGSINLCLPNIHAHKTKKKVGWFGSYFVITFLKG